MFNDTIEIELKQCTKCGEKFPNTNEFFHLSKSCKNGLRPQCKFCVNAFVKNHYYEHLDEERDRCSKKNDARREALKEYYRNNTEQKRIKMRKYRQEHLEQRREYDKSRKEQRRVINQIRYAKKISQIIDFSFEDWQDCLEYFDDSCAVCGRKRDLLTTIAMDHWVPINKGGSTIKKNIVPLCHSLKGGTDGCNQCKSDRDAHDWILEKYGVIIGWMIIQRIELYLSS